VQGATDFAFRLSAALAGDSVYDNLVLSPLSVWLPLVALINATEMEYREALSETLGVKGISEEEINQAVARILYELTSSHDTVEGSYNPLKLINAAFVSKEFTIRRSFTQLFSDYYNGTLYSIDFQSTQAVQEINKWASNSTEGLSGNVVDGFHPSTRAIIVNAMYFADRWRGEFDVNDTKEDTFYSPSGEQSANFMLREGNNQSYYEDDIIQAVRLEFMTGGGMYILLPKNGDAMGFLSSMTSEKLDYIAAGVGQRTGKLLIPRFSINNVALRLNDELKALGIPFIEEHQGSILNGLVEEDVLLWISDVRQKAVIEVDENGTTAAAVTVISADGEYPSRHSDPFEMVCNTPFVFILYELTSRGETVVLFSGIVNAP